MITDINNRQSTFHIWIIGNTVLMDGIATCLEERRLDNLVRWETLKNGLEANRKTGKPDLVIFELDSPGSIMFLDLLKEQPGIQLLGIDRNCSQAVLMNSVLRRTRTIAELYQIVQEVILSRHNSGKEEKY